MMAIKPTGWKVMKSQEKEIKTAKKGGNCLWNVYGTIINNACKFAKH